MKFLSEVASKALMPKQSLIATLKKNMQGMEKARCHLTVHASDVTKEDFCPRKVALVTLLEQKMPDQFIPTALRATFDIGNTVSDLVREHWLGEHAIGNWACHRCGAFRTMVPKPGKAGCSSGMKSHAWKYEEVRFKCEKTGIDGGIDVLVRLGSAKMFVTECKIVAAEAFEKLSAPLAEHRIRTNLYLYLVEKSGMVWSDMINTQVAKVLYVSRGYGKKHPDFDEVLPFKEYDVERNDEDLAPYLEMGEVANRFFKTGEVPPGRCVTAKDECALTCPVRKECFSGKYPEGMIWKAA